MTATEPCCGYPNSTHYMGCDCREAEFAQKLAAAEARIRSLESAAAAREAVCVAHMEARVAAEERARKLEEALDRIGWHPCRRNYYSGGRSFHCPEIKSVDPRDWCPSCIANVTLGRDLAAALAPPPSAAPEVPK